MTLRLSMFLAKQCKKKVLIIRICNLGNYIARFDQMGLMIRVDEKNYIKTGVEFVDGKFNISTVVTHDKSDWSVTTLDKAPPFIWIKVVRRLDAVEVFYSFDDKNYINLSIQHPNSFLFSRFQQKTSEHIHITWCVLKINPKYIYEKNTLFSVTNAANSHNKRNVGVTGDFEKFKNLKVDDKIFIRSRSAGFSHNHPYLILSGDFIEHESKVLFKRQFNKNDGC